MHFKFWSKLTPEAAAAGFTVHTPDGSVTHCCATGLLVTTLAVSVARTGALLRNYSTPMAVFAALPAVRHNLRKITPGNLCFVNTGGTRQTHKVMHPAS